MPWEPRHAFCEVVLGRVACAHLNACPPARPLCRSLDRASEGFLQVPSLPPPRARLVLILCAAEQI